jgi:hypothetical protein
MSEQLNGVDIDVTPEMIKAGVEAYESCFDPEIDEVSAMVAQVYREMVLASRKLKRRPPSS